MELALPQITISSPPWICGLVWGWNHSKYSWWHIRLQYTDFYLYLGWMSRPSSISLVLAAKSSRIALALSPGRLWRGDDHNELNRPQGDAIVILTVTLTGKRPQ